MLSIYSLKVRHTGTETGDFCVYQTNDNQSEDIHSLVWFKKRAHPETNLSFKWSLEYSFTWNETGVLVPGVIYETSQERATDPLDLSRNSIGFTNVDEAFKFKDTDELTTLGRLGISCDESIPTRVASVGIAMSGRPAFACTASPNMKYIFRPHPRYWIAFGKFDEGEVIDLNRMTRKFEIVFHEDQYEKLIRLSETNTWIDESKGNL